MRSRRALSNSLTERLVAACGQGPLVVPDQAAFSTCAWRVYKKSITALRQCT